MNEKQIFQSVRDLKGALDSLCVEMGNIVPAKVNNMNDVYKHEAYIVMLNAKTEIERAVESFRKIVNK